MANTSVFALLITLLTLLTSCGAGPIPMPTSAPATALPPTQTAATSRSLPSPATSRNQPLPSGTESTLFLGVPAGDGYSPIDLAVDAQRRLAYVYTASSPEQTSGISVVDLTSGQVRTRLITHQKPLGGGQGSLLLSADGSQGYLVEGVTKTLTGFDPLTGRLEPRISDAVDARLSPDGATLYLAQENPHRLTALRTADFQERWSVASGTIGLMAADADQVLISAYGEQRGLFLYAAADGALLASAISDSYVDGLAAGPQGRWAVRLSGDTPFVRIYSAKLEPLAEAPALWGSGLFYDAPRQRYLLAGSGPAPGAPDAYRHQILALDATQLNELIRRPWPDSYPPTHFASFNDAGLVSLARYGQDRLELLDAESLRPTRRVILGVRLEQMVLDEAAARLYVADNQERILLLDLHTPQVEAIWPGAAPLALDALNQTLYVNRPLTPTAGRSDQTRVVGLALPDGTARAAFPQAGVPAPDPQRDLVYIVRQGVTAYSRAGVEIGRLDSTFPIPQGVSPNPLAFAAAVNPVSGSLAVFMNNGVPGSNNRNYLRIYPPPAGEADNADGQELRLQDEPIEPPFMDNILTQLAFDPASGEMTFVYGSFRSVSGVQVLDGSGQELRRLGGRVGTLALDSRSQQLYLSAGGVLAQFAAPSLTLSHLYRVEPDDEILFSVALQRFYQRSQASSTLRITPREQLRPVEAEIRAAAASLPTLAVSSLQFDPPTRTAAASFHAYAVVGGSLYRSVVSAGSRQAESLSWQRLQVGSDLPTTRAELTVPAAGVLLWAASGPHGGDGLLRSQDGGRSWELLTVGLPDLRTSHPLLALSPDELYFLADTGGLQRWHPFHARWQALLPAPFAYELGSFALTADGTLFRVHWEAFQRSDDHGQSWMDLPLPGSGLRLLGSSPAYSQDQTLYAIYGQTPAQLARSTDGGASWHQIDAGLFLLDYANATLAVDGDTLYLLLARYSDPSRLYRSPDRGKTWLAADSQQADDAIQMAQAPDGTLWFGGRDGGVTILDPTAMAWQRLAAANTAAAPTPLPATAAPTLTLTPLPPPCPQPLSGLTRELADAHPTLGCPVEEEQTVLVAYQPFLQGAMIWRSDLRQIYVLAAAGSWHAYADSWQEGQPISDPTLVPPTAGLHQPVRGFGKLWREELGGPDGQLGWASAAEQGSEATVQRWQNGLAIRLSAGLMVLQDDSSWFHYRQ